jgi:hypothetical protein
MTFGGKDFTLDPRDAITQEGDTCFGTIEISNDSVFKIGNPFLRNVYTCASHRSPGKFTRLTNVYIRIFGATFNGKEANFSVGFADKVQRTANGTSSSGSKPTNTASNVVPSTSISNLLSLLVVTSIILVLA